jgi:hypothetical protein
LGRYRCASPILRPFWARTLFRGGRWPWGWGAPPGGASLGSRNLPLLFTFDPPPAGHVFQVGTFDALLVCPHCGAGRRGRRCGGRASALVRSVCLPRELAPVVLALAPFEAAPERAWDPGVVIVPLLRLAVCRPFRALPPSRGRPALGRAPPCLTAAPRPRLCWRRDFPKGPRVSPPHLPLPRPLCCASLTWRRWRPAGASVTRWSAARARHRVRPVGAPSVTEQRQGSRHRLRPVGAKRPGATQ